ncbi:Methyltransferase-16 [Cordyceps javanica]|uniref:Methyltransferase-16 n=1 Tax=Cordyceps javanica TaxID=43265 RepID=A0A545VLG1_9HYPO|nr:Methyltransferase-16 [Cordyceps javanica]TQW02520.1 Methyltransferase-16 [Cordyceps javanica]
MAPWQASVDRFCHQYLQLEAEPTLPPAEFLKLSEAQEAIYDRAFSDRLRYAPPQRHQLRVLKALVAAIERSIDEDWEQYALSDNLMSALTTLLAAPLPSEVDAARQKCYVTYALSLLPRGGEEAEAEAPSPPTITLLENRSLISAGGTTGLRTWEAALHLGQYLCERPAIVRGRRVLELGAGTGYLSILCARHLRSAHVVASDGSDDVLANLPDSLLLNGLPQQQRQEEEAGASSSPSSSSRPNITPMELEWGHTTLAAAAARGQDQDQDQDVDVDVVLGADITYDGSVIPALTATLRALFARHPRVEVYVAATQRNRATFAVFLDACRAGRLAVEDLGYAATPREAQTGPFYSDAVEIRVCRIRRDCPDAASPSETDEKEGQRSGF